MGSLKPIDMQLQHLLWRTGFGPQPQTWTHWQSLPQASVWLQLKAESQAQPVAFDVADTMLKGLLMGIGEAGKMERRELDAAEKKQVRQQSREDLKSLNLLWLEEMTHSKAQLREKMALFWHGHFASRNINILYQQQLLQVVRDNALGNFGDLLRGVSKTAAMLAFLNNVQNKKAHPNENFAREVMELFTQGRGNYTENDVKEAARAFTGWAFRLNGEFVFRPRDHDTGSKTIFGKTGNFDGDDVLNMLLERRETARFIARKMYRFLVNDAKVPTARIEWLGDRFYDSGYKIIQLLDDIVTSDWFYAPENVGTRIKSPVELWVGLRRTLSLQLANPETQLVLEKALGQVLFFPPNVAGWPGGKDWIDSSSLMLRLRIPQLLFAQSDLDVRTKSDDDQQMGQGEKGAARQRFAATIDWDAIVKLFAQTPDDQVVKSVADFLWQAPKTTLPAAVLEAYTDRSNHTDRVKAAIVQLMATPEYQLC